jgi:hypothetical protein
MHLNNLNYFPTPGCGSNLVGPNGYLNISSVTMPPNFGMQPMCEWNVTVRPGRTIKVDIEYLYITGGADCNDGYLMVNRRIVKFSIKY